MADRIEKYLAERRTTSTEDAPKTGIVFFIVLAISFAGIFLLISSMMLNLGWVLKLGIYIFGGFFGFSLAVYIVSLCDRSPDSSALRRDNVS